MNSKNLKKRQRNTGLFFIFVMIILWFVTAYAIAADGYTRTTPLNPWVVLEHEQGTTYWIKRDSIVAVHDNKKQLVAVAGQVTIELINGSKIYLFNTKVESVIEDINR